VILTFLETADQARLTISSNESASTCATNRDEIRVSLGWTSIDPPVPPRSKVRSEHLREDYLPWIKPDGETLHPLSAASPRRCSSGSERTPSSTCASIKRGGRGRPGVILRDRAHRRPGTQNALTHVVPLRGGEALIGPEARACHGQSRGE